MPTSVHIPKPLLAAIDRRARMLKLSRNRLIIRALEQDLAGRAEWSPGFFARLEQVERDDAKVIDEMLEAIRARRGSRIPVRL